MTRGSAIGAAVGVECPLPLTVVSADILVDAWSAD
jgi:hypothetical protein